MPVRVLLVDSDQTSARWLKTILDREGLEVEMVASASAAMSRIEQSQPKVLVTEVALSDGDGLEMIRRLRGNPNTRDLHIIILSVKTKPEDILNGLQAGANDYIPKRPGAEADLIGKIRAFTAFRKPSPRNHHPSPGRAKIISFCSAKGGTGTTSICLNLGYAISQLEPQAKIAVVDMVLPVGTVGPFLDTDLPMTITKLTQESAVNRATVERYLTKKNNWGLDLMLGANEPQQAAEIDVSRLPIIFQVLSEMYDYLLIDFGKGLSRLSLPIIESSTGVVVITTSDVNTVRVTRPLLKYLESHDVTQDRIFVINNRTTGRMWTTSDDMQKMLGIKPHASIPYAVESMTLSINEAMPFPIKFPEHPVSAALTNIARALQERFPSPRKQE